MAGRAFPIQTNFTAGEIDEIVSGRVDINKYNNGTRIMENFIPFQQGGIKRRPGFRFVAEVKDSTKLTGFLPFQFSVEQNYVLEAGDNYFRFYTLDGRLESPPGTPIEIVTPYGTADLFELQFTQSADVLYITHPDYPTKQLKRIDATTWTLTNFVPDPPPTFEGGHTPAADLTLAATTGTGITFTASAAVFLDGDIDRQITGEGGRATITSVTDSTHVVVDIIEDFPDTAIDSGDWTLNGSPGVDLDPSKDKPKGGQTTLTAKIGGSATNAWRSEDIGKYVYMNNGIIKLNNFTDAQHVDGEILRKLDDKSLIVSGNWTLEENSWTASRGYPSTCGFFGQRLLFAGSDSEPEALIASRVNVFTDFGRGTNDDDPFKHILIANKVNIIRWISSANDLLVGASGLEWKVTGGLNEPITPSNVFAKDQTAWGSELIKPIKADKATIFVQFGGNKLREFKYDFDVDGYVSNDLMLMAPSIGFPSITQITFEPQPVPILWAVRSDGVLLSLVYDPRQEVFAWSRHITDGEVEAVCHSFNVQTKQSQVWAIIKRFVDGSYVRYIEYMDQAVDISNNHNLYVDSGLSYDGTNNSGTVTPGATTGTGITFTAGGGATFAAGDVGKEIRQINGGTGRATIVSYTDPTHVVADITVDFPGTGAIAAGDWGLAVKSVSGLDHLEGKEVQIVGDGAVYPNDTVASGVVSLNGPFALYIDVGLQYIAKIVTNRPAVETGNGSSVFLTKGINKIIVLFYKTIGAEINDIQVTFRDKDDYMDAAVGEKTYLHEEINLGTDRDAFMTIRQTQPLPITIVALQTHLTTGDE